MSSNSDRRGLAESLEAAAAASTVPPGTRAVVLAGGRGTRLAPFTSVLPKPLMPVGNRAVLEIIVEQLVRAGFKRITLSVGYLSHLIQAVFDNGGLRRELKERVTISYVHESEPLGTAAPLRMVDDLDGTFLVMNGDVLTTLDYGALLRSHHRSGNVLTIATQRRTISTDYGVLHVGEADEGLPRVVAYEEKPEITSHVSMGIYALEPSALAYIPESGCFDFPDLVQALLEAGLPVGAYTHDGIWLDIGRKEDYERASTAWLNGFAVEAGSTEPATPDTL
jgi:NDP-mannose synthase